MQAVLEVEGDLKMVDKENEEEKLRRVDMSVLAKFVYDEKTLHLPERGDGPVRSVRYYHQAEGTVQSGERSYEPSLREERRLVGVEVDGPEVTLFSPRGPLTSDELELIDVLANSLVLDRLLPQRGVTVQSGWKHADDVVAAMLGLDAVAENGVKSVLTGVGDGIARLEIAGEVDGSEDGVSTSLKLKGKYHFDLKAKRVVWFGLLVQEDREVGNVDAGFDVVARLQMKITPGRKSKHLTGAALSDLPLEPTPELTQLTYEPPEAKWRLAHDRRWFVITEEKDRAVLRMLDGKQKLAQCNVAALPQADDPTKLTLEQFQQDVVRALDESFKSLVRANQLHTEADYRQFRVVAEGEASGVPMQWIYYLLTDKQGRRVVLAFVLEKEKLDRFQAADAPLVAALRFTEPQIASK